MPFSEGAGSQDRFFVYETKDEIGRVVSRVEFRDGKPYLFTDHFYNKGREEWVETNIQGEVVSKGTEYLDSKGRVVRSRSTSAEGKLIYDKKITYDKMGRILRERVVVGGRPSMVEVYDYHYDGEDGDSVIESYERFKPEQWEVETS